MKMLLLGVMLGAFGMWIFHWLWDVYWDHRGAQQLLKRMREDQKRDDERRDRL